MIKYSTLYSAEGRNKEVIIFFQFVPNPCLPHLFCHQVSMTFFLTDLPLNSIRSTSTFLCLQLLHLSILSSLMWTLAATFQVAPLLVPVTLQSFFTYYHYTFPTWNSKVSHCTWDSTQGMCTSSGPSLLSPGLTAPKELITLHKTDQHDPATFFFTEVFCLSFTWLVPSNYSILSLNIHSSKRLSHKVYLFHPAHTLIFLHSISFKSIYHNL